MAIETIGGVFSLANQSIVIGNISNVYFNETIQIDFTWARLSGDFTIELWDVVNEESPTIPDFTGTLAIFAQEVTSPTILTASNNGSYTWTGDKKTGVFKLRIYSNTKPSIYAYSNQFTISEQSLAIFAMKYPSEPIEDNNRLAIFADEIPVAPVTIEKVNDTIVMT